MANQTCALCNRAPYTDRHGKTWDLCLDHCRQLWGGDHPPKPGTNRRGVCRRGDTAATQTGDFAALPQVTEPAPPDHSTWTHPIRMVLFDLQHGEAVMCECTPVSGRFDLAPDTPSLKEQIRNAAQAGYVLAWRMTPKSDEENHV